LHIIDQALLTVCACPAQVAREIENLAQVIRYQEQCLETASQNRESHQQIAESCRQALASLENCLLRVLELEGWDLETLTMPAAITQSMVEAQQAYRSTN
jgi:hypothetical protein